MITPILKRHQAGQAYRSFLKAYPEYAATMAVDRLRKRDCKTFDKTGEVYLDYTGAGRYGASLVRRHMQLATSAIFGNPHSDNPSSRRSTEWAVTARQAVLDYFNASDEEYTVIFTANASGALHLVAESYPFAAGGSFLQLLDNHNSVNGIREFAKARGASHNFIPLQKPDMRASVDSVKTALKQHGTEPHLFAYPAQSNFSGVQHPLDWIKTAQQEGWDVLLDAAAFVPTNRLDLSVYKPDYVSISFYKMFGWPTGVGCLIARKPALAKLHKPWFAGGTIWAVSVQADWHVLAPGHEAFEDGTVNYLNLPAVTYGLEYLDNIGIDTIHTRTSCLTQYLIRQLQNMKHSNGRPLIRMYGPDTVESRGATVAFNFLTPDGKIVDERIVERRANQHRISLRTGCFCNPGSGEAAFGLPAVKLSESFSKGKQVDYDQYLSLLGLESAGAIRVSLGLFSNFADVQALLGLARTFIDQEPDAKDLPVRSHC